jgi:hypothetical protein
MYKVKGKICFEFCADFSEERSFGKSLCQLTSEALVMVCQSQ